MWKVEGLDGGEEGGFAGVVEAEEEDGVFFEGRRRKGLALMAGREEHGE